MNRVSSRRAECVTGCLIAAVVGILLLLGYCRYQAWQADRQVAAEQEQAALDADPIYRIDLRLGALEAKLDEEIPALERKLAVDLKAIRSDWEHADAVQRVGLEQEIRDVASLKVALENYRKQCADVTMRLRSAKRGLERARLSEDTMGAEHGESLNEADQADMAAAGILAVQLDKNMADVVDELAVEKEVQRVLKETP